MCSASGAAGMATHRCHALLSPFKCRALAHEVSTKGGKGVEPAMRITYDDANECFVLPQNVRRIIRDVGGCVALSGLRTTAHDEL